MPELGIDPVLIEEFADNGASARAECLVTFLNDAPGRRPIAGRRIGKERSIAIVIVQPVQAKEPGLEPVIALDHMVMPFRRRHQGLDDRVADFVCQMARGHRRGEVAKLAVGLMVQDQVIEDEGQQASVVLKPRGQAVCRGLANASIRVIKPGVDLLQTEQIDLTGVFIGIL